MKWIDPHTYTVHTHTHFTHKYTHKRTRTHTNIRTYIHGEPILSCDFQFSSMQGSNLTALVKSMQDSSLDIRPIAVGEACGSIEKRWGLGGTEERWDYKRVEGD